MDPCGDGNVPCLGNINIYAAAMHAHSAISDSLKTHLCNGLGSSVHLIFQASILE